jgi:hypothetical protein
MSEIAAQEIALATYEAVDAIAEARVESFMTTKRLDLRGAHPYDRYHLTRLRFCKSSCSQVSHPQVSRPQPSRHPCKSRLGPEPGPCDGPRARETG